MDCHDLPTGTIQCSAPDGPYWSAGAVGPYPGAIGPYPTVGPYPGAVGSCPDAPGEVRSGNDDPYGADPYGADAYGDEGYDEDGAEGYDEDGDDPYGGTPPAPYADPWTPGAGGGATACVYWVHACPSNHLTTPCVTPSLYQPACGATPPHRHRGPSA